MPELHLRPEYPVMTERLRLRPLTEADVPALLAYRSILEVTLYVPFEPMDAEAVMRQLEKNWGRTELDGEKQGLTLGIELAETGELIGDVVLFLTSVDDRGGEIGWILNPDHGGHGYATEAAAAMLDLAFNDLCLHRVVARVDARNDSSQRLCERLGMRREAHLIKNEWFKGDWSDEYNFAVLEEEWAARG